MSEKIYTRFLCIENVLVHLKYSLTYIKFLGTHAHLGLRFKSNLLPVNRFFSIFAAFLEVTAQIPCKYPEMSESQEASEQALGNNKWANAGS